MISPARQRLERAYWREASKQPNPGTQDLELNDDDDDGSNSPRLGRRACYLDEVPFDCTPAPMAEEMDIDGPDGHERRESGSPEVPSPPRRIKALALDVINKIAAGEIIVAPVHALKEMLENAVDAGSTAVEIMVKDGGLKLLQITDNGCGIQKDDLAILCERHTTSKLSTFEDLTSIGTYGFRGEALASISHIAHLTVTTKTKDSAVAWRAHYLDGTLAAPKPGQPAEPKAVAGRLGTQITVEDLFFSMPLRRRAFRSPADEYNKILDMVGRYAVHCAAVGFTCKKAGDPSTSLSVQPHASTVDRIRHVYGASIANELIDLSAADGRWGFKAHGLVSNANYHIKKTRLLLFVNHRSVESTHIRKAVEQIYVKYLPKGGHPFVYLSLEIEPARVDVNVHPTKREVHFLNEDEIIQAVCSRIDDELAAVDNSRTFTTQTLLPGASRPLTDDEPPTEGSPRINGHVHPQNHDHVPPAATTTTTTTTKPSSTADEPLAAPEKIEYESTDRSPVVCRLRSIKELRSEVRASAHRDLTEKFSSHAFVGIVDERRRLAAMQSGVKLYLVDYGLASYEYFYQLGLTDFGNFGTMRFVPPLSLTNLLTMAAEAEKKMLASSNEPHALDTQTAVQKVSQQLIQRREMLQEYFSLEITPTGDLVSIPLLQKGYTPSLAKLPRFLLHLGPKVRWTDEKACFDSFLRELAAFYAPERLPPAPAPGSVDARADGEGVPEEVRERRRHVRWAVEHLLSRGLGGGFWRRGGWWGVVEVADLKGLYRVFERC
ncbi:MutL-like protein [Ophiocordyceps camponoti-floridani]|uniref:MutL-like protein n=1 Tax=Ophiocordyceps camponoti-floridani TaxID=2030778 RepID=A0A8H4Q637_9HYPO|nr:MutL-like protein [Ophiocordyceps camponoti-floridani]